MEDKSEEDVSGLRQNKALYIRQGQQLATRIFEEQETVNQCVTWAIRIIGFILMYVGLFMILNPVVTILRVIPFIGTFFANLLAIGLWFAVLICCFILTMVFVSLSWIFARPIPAISVIALGVGVFVLVAALKKHS